jgi:superfamily II DNA or RNA helicase
VGRFITNQQDLLSELLKTYIPNSKQLDFLVGYFYFSGFYSIYKEIARQQIRILVGMEADVTVSHIIREFADMVQDGKIPSNLKIRQAFYETTKKIINQADIVDSKEGEDAFRFFVEKLQNGTLEVRKTKEPAHAKLYIFANNDEHSEGGHYPGKVIIGSSNLSFQGLRGRTEVIATLRDSSDYTEAEEIFNKLWNDAITLVDQTTKDDFVETVVKHTWVAKNPAPYVMYVRVLYEYFKDNTETIKTPAALTHTNDLQYMNLVYQTDAISEGLEKIRRHSGCIVADVVGLGKSIIAVTIAANLNMTTIVICPPHLKSQWEDFAFDFGLQRYKIVSSGKIEDALTAVSGSIDEKLIIIDEAHRYRNENTMDYGLLHRTCIGNKVLLLSATPFNNRPEDIFSLIKLFQIPSHSTIQVVNNLGAAMEQLIVDYKKLKNEQAKGMSEDQFKAKAKEISRAIRHYLDPVLIRRTRVDLLNSEKYKEDLARQNIEFSDMEPPQEQMYDLGLLSELYLETLNQLTGVVDAESKIFTGARYRPLTYLKDDKKILDKYRKLFDNPNPQEGQRNMAIFMRRLLVRRFESSIYSFKKTLGNIIVSMENVKKWHATFKKIPLYKKNSLPDFDDIEATINEETDGALFIEDIDDILERKLTPPIEKGLILVNADELKDDFIQDLESDIALFNAILTKWESLEFRGDPKFKGLFVKIQEAIKKEPNRKIIVFSEFMDTVDYLEEKFKEQGLRVIKYSSKTMYSKNIIKMNFDAGMNVERQVNDYDLLVATDAISEGFSLHRAGTIYNYDIPYNPTRVIQRVGRINRINKRVFEKLNIYNFFPSATGEALSRTKSIATFKMLLIQTIFGSDTKILTEDEITEGYLDDEFRKAKAETDSPSWKIEFQNEFDLIKRNEQENFKQALALPQRCRTGRIGCPGSSAEIATKETKGDLFKNVDQKGVLLFSEKGGAYRFCFADENGETVILSPSAGLSFFRSSKDEKAQPTTEGFYPLYERAKGLSGHSAEKANSSKNIIDLINKINLIKNTAGVSSDDKRYLDNLRKTTGELNALPLYYIKRLLDVDIGDINKAMKEFRNIVIEEYIFTILEKDNKIMNEAENIILSEQFI